MRANKLVAWSVILGACLVLFLTGTGTYLLVSHQRGIKSWQKANEAAIRGELNLAIEQYHEALQHELWSRQRGLVCMERGSALNQKGRFDEAIRDFTEAIRRVNMAAAYAGRSFAFLEKGRFAETVKDAAEAIRRDPNCRNAYHNRGMAYLQTKQFENAIIDFSEAIRCDPNNVDLYYKRGMAFAGKKDFDSAIASFESVIALAPKLGTGYWGRAAAYEAKGDWEHAISDYDTAYRLASDRKSAEPILTAAWARKKVFDDNQASLRTYVNEKRAYELLNKGIKASREKRYEEAVKSYNEALELHPGERNRAVLHCNRATSYGALKKLDLAARDYNEAIHIEPDFVEAYYNRGINDRELGQIDKAVADFSEALRLNPGYARAYVDRASIYAQRHDLQRANADYVKALETIDQVESEARPAILNHLAWMWATAPLPELRDGKEAIAAATKACELSNWKDWQFIDTLAAAYAEAGMFQSAVSYQTRVLQSKELESEQKAKVEGRLRLYQQQKPYREAKAKKTG